MTKKLIKKVNCFKCKYFYITWDIKFPNACKKMGFKGKEMPSQTVIKSTGHACQMFEEKK